MSEDPKARARRGRNILRALVSIDSFGSVLVLILITYILSVTLTARWERSLVLMVQMATVWLALHVSRARRSVRIFSSGALVLAGIVAIANLFGRSGQGSDTLVFATSSLLYLIAPVSILRAIVVSGEVDRETVFGAVDAYLLIGMFFAFTYRAIGAYQSTPFFGANGKGTVPQVLFFSFTTLTTTGYGNLVPAGNPGQTFAVMEMLIGQLFLVTAVAKVINAWKPRGWRAAQQDDDPEDQS